jgi:hypothetical protein
VAFDDVLSTAEVAAATRFWRETARGRRDAEAKRWASSPAPTAEIVRPAVQAFAPLNPADKPAKITTNIV